jgi:histone deacetylase 6
MVAIKSRYATDEELQLAHTERYVKNLNKIFNNNEKTISNSMEQKYESIYANRYTLECAYLAAGSTLELVNSIANPNADSKIGSGVAIVRPPGHHAKKESAAGFCIFNNVAISAIHCSKNLGKRVAIVDFDVHQGDGTLNIVGGMDNIYFFSIHRYDKGTFYPGQHKPVNQSTYPNVKYYEFNGTIGTDSDYMNIFNKDLIPNLKTINPDIIIVSAGFDAGINDPLGGFAVTPSGYTNMVGYLKTVCPSIALVLEGGYNLKTISESMANCVGVLLNDY